MKAIIYARYSSHNQTEQSIEGQIRVCTEYAQRHDMTLHGMYVDRATTGTNDNRPDFQRMLKDSKKGLFDVVLVYKFDRFARNRYDSANNKRILRANGVKLVSATENIPDSPEGIMLESLLEGMAEYYSAELSQKILRGKRETALKLQHHGGIVPFGYALDENRRYIPDETTAPIVADLFERYANGERMTHLATELNLLQLKTNKNSGFTRGVIIGILKNPVYIGTYKVSDFVQENAFAPIVGRELFDKVQEIIAKNKMNPAKNKARKPYLLSGKVVCGECGSNIVGNSGTSRGEYRQYYMCSGRKKKICQKSHIRRDELETIVFDIVVENFQNVEKKKILVEKVLAYQKTQNEEKDIVQGYRHQLADTKKKKENLLSALEKSGSCSPTILARVEELEQAEIHLGDEILRNTKYVPVFDEKTLLRYFDQIFSQKSERLKEEILKNTVCYVKLFDDKVIICFNLLDENGDNVEIREELDCLDLGGCPYGIELKSKQIEIGLSGGVIWILTKINPPTRQG